MILFPAIDILEGRAVRLYKGDRNAVTDYGDPLEFAEKWAEAGAQWLHIVDLSGAFSGKSGIDKTVSEIKKRFKINVQSGGGLRTVEDAERRLDAGADRIVLGCTHYPFLAEVIADEAIEPISRLKTAQLGSRNPRLHPDETLIALSITSATSEVAARVLAGLPKLRGCDAFFSVIISSTDEALLKKLGINVCCEPKYERHTFYHR